MLPEMRYIEQELLPMLRERRGVQEAKAAQQLSQWAGTPGVCSLMITLKGESVPELKNLPDYDLREIHYDPEKMFVSGLKAALTTALADGDAVPSLRANVGVGCVNTLLGGLKQTFFPDKMPWLLQHLTAEEMNALTIENLEESPEFRFGMDCMRFMKEELEGTGIEVFPIDIQGPVDLAHLWLGNEFFYLIYDEPETVHHALDLAVKCDIYAFEKCLEIIKPKDHVCHYNSLILPVDKPIKISEDTSTLLSKAHIEEFMAPYTRRLFSHFGGGYIHYCGDNRHLLPVAETFENSIGLNFGNPERYDFDEILPALGKNGKCYLTLSRLPNDHDALVKASRREDGSFNIFLTASCRKEEQEAVLEKHRLRVEEAMKG